MSRRVLALSLVTTLVIAADVRAAGLSRCTVAIGKAVENYVLKKYQVMATCERRRSDGSIPPSTNCRPADGAVTDGSTAGKLASAAAQLLGAISAKCPGPLPPLGPACNSATTAADLAACVSGPTQDADIDNRNVDQIIETVYDANAPVTDEGLFRCQQEIRRAGGKYLRKRLKLARRCHMRLGRGLVDGCLDLRALRAIERHRAKMDASIRETCTEAQLAASSPPKLDFGFPCETYKLTSYRRGVGGANTLPVLDRAIRCLTDAFATVSDYSVSIGFPAPEPSAFAQGVAAGDATDTAAVFWTRLPDSASGGFLDVSTDPGFETGVQTIAVGSPPGTDGTVKEDVGSLTPATEYFYRFRQGAETSRTGRVVTAPTASDATRVVRLAWSGDLNAYYLPASSLDPLRLQDPDAFLFIGDTIYGDDPRADGLVADAFSEYAAKYKGNLADQSLRALSAATGTYKQWDDHEVRNDFAGAGILGAAFAAKMADGNLAFRRYAPLRDDTGDPMQLYRSFQWGSGAEIFLIDDRQYRSAKYTCCNSAVDSGFVTTDADSTCPGGMAGEALLPTAACSGPTAMGDPSRTILGAAQKTWLENGLLNSTAKFKFIMNGPPMTQLLFLPYDRWEAWIVERNDLLDFIQTNNIKNVVWLSTDLHAVVISPDFLNSDDLTHPGVEFVVGSIAETTLFRELPASIVGVLPSVPFIIGQVDDYEIDRYNGALVTVDPVAGTAKIDIYDRTGLLIDSRTLTAVP
jgi:alkaline phosphatase D